MVIRASALRTTVYTVFALVAFAANSVLTRLALEEPAIDPASYTTIRLVSGATALLLISVVHNRRSLSRSAGSWISAVMLFLYALTFSFAYLSLSAATGALILFGAVQTTMIVSALLSGERPRLLEWLGLFLAMAGLVYLVFPGLTAPSPLGTALMVVAGISWGVYSLRGRRAQNPLVDTTSIFLRSVPLVLLVSLLSLRYIQLSVQGVLLALVSGAVTSGLGYVIWYAALRGLTATRAATVQLAVPVLAAIGAVIFLSEDISLRLILSGVLILGGVVLAVLGRSQLNRVS